MHRVAWPAEDTRGVIVMMWFGWGSGSWVSWLVMSLMMLVFWGGLVALIVWAVRGFARPPESSKPDPLAILEERFARGEIDADELESRRTALTKSGSSRAA